LIGWEKLEQVFDIFWANQIGIPSQFESELECSPVGRGDFLPISI
jgi:hypothetical protein